MTDLVHIAERVFNTPLLLLPDKAETILFALKERLLGGALDAPNLDASRFIGSRKRADGNPTIFRQEAGVAIVTVAGSLVNRGAWIDANSGLVSYEGIAAQVKAAAADPSIATIVLDLDTPGGEAGGMVGLASAIRAARASKRVVAVVDDMAASAGYGIASAADEIVISPTSIVGSIGVVLLHLDRSAELEAKGVKPTLIHAGAHKVDGNPFGALPDAVRADLQASVNSLYEKFLSTVADGRGAQSGRRGRTLRTLSVDRARETEARTFIGAEALDRGLADRIGTLDEIVADYSSTSRASTRARQGTPSMSHPADMVSAAEHTSAIAAAVAEARAEASSVMATAVAAAKAEGIAEERARVSGIKGLDETKGREAHAEALIAAGLSVDQAKVALAGMPKGAASIAARHAATGDTLNPVDGPAPVKASAPTSSAAEIIANRRAAVAAANR